MTFSVSDVQEGLRAESQDLPDSLSFKVTASRRIDDAWHVELDPETATADNGKRNIVLDEALEGARAWWSGPPKGKADVMAVIPEESALLLSSATSTPPSNGHWIRIYTQDYLSILRDIWQRTDWSTRAISYQEVLSRVSPLEPIGISPALFPHLRSAQRKAFDLLDYETSFLWGPPGTGKTTTLGALMATCVVQKPKLRILLVGTTNQAVDQALVAVDRALEKLGRDYTDQRRRLCRFGSRFIAEHYQGRDHLIPIQDKELLHKLRRVELEKPDEGATPEALAKWHQQRQQLRDRIRAQMAALFREKSIVAMTATRAAHSLDDLNSLGQFDLLVFDEASQLGLANVLCLLPLARRLLFAGDDRQLSPIVTSQNKKAIAVLGKSPFIYRGTGADRGNTVMLDEQSRMAEQICRAVGEAFYFGKLKVAGDALSAPTWAQERTFKFADIGGDSALNAVDVAAEGQWSQKYRGLIRHESATKIAEMMAGALSARQVSASDIVVLTPFRAQRVLIKNCLYHQGVKGVKVSTVHRSQGSEAKVVIFDPVKGNEDFLTNSEGARLINVALSRAMGKLILFLSPGKRNRRATGQSWPARWPHQGVQPAT
ncbi:MAG: hypothetical protein B7Z03_07695 [Hydrogenophilales bacterium 32-62-9]|nr:MAG: hypothetical protein B7Z03_07695 [Hydrogenophilales bacterium 32-62-9]